VFFASTLTSASSLSHGTEHKINEQKKQKDCEAVRSMCFFVEWNLVGFSVCRF